MPNTDETLPTPPADPNATLARPGDASPGALHIPGYDLLPKIAEGGMGVVYRARDLAFDREVAIKVMKPGMNAAEFVREAKVTARLPHPGIPPVYAMSTLPDGRPYLAMKLIQGETLDAVLKRRTEFVTDRGKLLAAFEQMCHAVGYAHAQGLIHRDLKPSNVMVGAFGEVQVMDWGLARSVDSGQQAVGSEVQSNTTTVPDASDDVLKTVAGQIKGTPAYMAPEQARGEPVDTRADVFALGGILAAILTGQPPFAGNSVLDTIIRAARAELSDTLARLDASGADADLLALCKKSLSANAADRHADATALALAVAAYRAEVEARFLRAERERAAAEARAVEEENTRREAEARASAEARAAEAETRAEGAERTRREAEADRKRRFVQRALTALVLLLLLAGGGVIAFAHLWDEERKATFAAEANVDKQKRIAEKANIARKEVEQEREKLAEKLASDEYARTIQVARLECFVNNQEGARVLLDRTRPDFRKWEWHYVNYLANAKTGAEAEVLTLKGHTSYVCAASCSADGTRIATASIDGTTKVWDAKTGAEVLTLAGHTGRVSAASFSADGTRIVTASNDKTAKVWDAKTGAVVLTLKGHTSVVTAASFSADGTLIVTGSADWTAKVWDAKTGAVVRTLKGHMGGVYAASFSADGTRIVTGGDQTAKVWDAKTGAELLTLKADTSKVWDAKTGAAIRMLGGNTSSVPAAAFSADGTRIVTVGDRTAKVWYAPPSLPVAPAPRQK